MKRIVKIEVGEEAFKAAVEALYVIANTSKEQETASRASMALGALQADVGFNIGEPEQPGKGDPTPPRKTPPKRKAPAKRKVPAKRKPSAKGDPYSSKASTKGASKK